MSFLHGVVNFAFKNKIKEACKRQPTTEPLINWVLRRDTNRLTIHEQQQNTVHLVHVQVQERNGEYITLVNYAVVCK